MIKIPTWQRVFCGAALSVRPNVCPGLFLVVDVIRGFGCVLVAFLSLRLIWLSKLV